MYGEIEQTLSIHSVGAIESKHDASNALQVSEAVAENATHVQDKKKIKTTASPLVVLVHS